MLASTRIDVLCASPRSSTIWRDVTEDEFRRHLVTLEQRTNAVPVEVQVFDIPKQEDDENSTGTRLSIEVEKQLADDFAYIAAVQEGAQSVAAVCVEQHLKPTRQLKLCIAAADAIDEGVRACLAGVCNILAELGHRQVTHNTSASDDIFTLVTKLHRQRILGRIRSCKWEKPRHLAASHKKPLWKDFTNLIHRVQHIYPGKKNENKREYLEDLLNKLMVMYKEFESLLDDVTSSGIMALIKATYNFFKDLSLTQYVNDLQARRPTDQIAAALKCLHQLEKKYQSLFRSIEIEYLQPCASVPTSIAYEPWAKTCHVHAEIQLVVHYDLIEQQHEKADNLQIVWPRTIGTSKYLCYLCYLFVHNHGRFFAANTHGRLYDQWTVPNIEQHGKAIAQKYADVLGKMDKTVTRKIEEEEPCRRVEPMTSRQNLLHESSLDMP